MGTKDSGESVWALHRACPSQCSCPRVDTVDCGGQGLWVFPENISKTVQHLSLQVGLEVLGAGQGRGFGQLGSEQGWGAGNQGGC